MFRLKVIAGPNRGASYEIRDSECSIGRQDGNTIVLQSNRVSKQHCRLVASNGEVLLEDQGSSNGTFVNGAQTRSRKLKGGDKISVGDFVFELLADQPVQRATRSTPPPVPGRPGQVLAFPGGMAGLPPVPAQPLSMQSMGNTGAFDMGGNATSAPQTKPTNLVDRIRFILDAKVMPYFYGLLFKHDLKFVGAGVFALFILVNLVVSVQPLVDLGTRLVVEEATMRARFMAKQIVEKNAVFIAQRAEIKADIGNFEKEPGVRIAVLIDLENRIIAPSSKINQYFTRGDAATYAVGQRKKFLNGLETGVSTTLEDHSVVAIEPLKIFDPTIGRNRVAALAVVSLDTEGANPAFTELGTSYADTMVRSGIFALIALFILYRITLKPFQVLNEDIDRVLRGEMAQVTHEFKIEELDSLWAVINSALTRIPRSGMQSSGGDSGSGFGSDTPDAADSFREIASIAPFASVVLDADFRIVFLNAGFENLSNARLDDVRGKLPSEAFGEGIPEYMESIMKRVSGGERGVSSTMEMSTGTYQIHGSAIVFSGVPKAWMFSATRNS